MLIIDKKNNTIQLTRGDTARLTVDVCYEDTNRRKHPYQIEDTDTLTLSVKKNTSKFKPLFQKVVKGGAEFHIEPKDTENLDFGKYKYDVQLNKANGEVYTVITPSVFEVMQEVT